MYDETRWRAKWTDRSGAERAHTFDGPASRAIARSDFQLECIAARKRIPEHFELEEATMVLSAIPSRTERVKEYQLEYMGKPYNVKEKGLRHGRV